MKMYKMYTFREVPEHGPIKDVDGWKMHAWDSIILIGLGLSASARQLSSNNVVGFLFNFFNLFILN